MSPRTVATFSVTAGVLLILGACSPLDDADLFGSKTLNVNFDGGVVVYENGKKVSCLATDKYGGCEKGTLEFCKNGYLYEASCASKPKCGWSAALNHYACGTAGGYQPIDGGGSAHDSYVQSCGKLPTQGCCDGGMLKFCKSSQQSFDDCTAKGKQCGWDGAKYACGTNTKSDPSKKYPRDCSNYITKQDAAPVVGDGGTGPGPQKCGKLPPEGCCGGNMLDFCQSGKKQSQDCAGNPKCGWDAAKKKYGCGTSGGKDPAGKFPINCKAYLSSSDGGSTGPDSSNPSGDGGGPGPGCGKLPAQGCCGGNQLDYCAGGAKLNKDCTGSPKCGWDPTKKKYACGTSGGKDPSGQYPKDCKSYLQAGDGGPGDGPGPPPGDGGKPPPLKDGGGGPGPGCGKLPPEGCCQGHMLDYCQNSKKASMSCQSKIGRASCRERV